MALACLINISPPGNTEQYIQLVLAEKLRLCEFKGYYSTLMISSNLIN